MSISYTLCYNVVGISNNKGRYPFINLIFRCQWEHWGDESPHTYKGPQYFQPTQLESYSDNEIGVGNHGKNCTNNLPKTILLICHNCTRPCHTHSLHFACLLHAN